MKGFIFNIQHFSIHDGPGIRTTVFLKGCPLKCPWCSNPESQNKLPEPMLDTISKKTTTVGSQKTVDEVIKEVLKDIDFYQESNGGLTLSGGEIFTQFDFAKAILIKAKEHNIHTAIETTGFTSQKNFINLIKYVDFIYLDLKHYDDYKHKKITGVSNQKIIENIKYAVNNHPKTVLRIPVIPNFNDTLDDAYKFANLLIDINAKEVQLLPFHQFGENKYNLLNRIYEMTTFKNLHPEDLKDYQQVFINMGINCYF